MRLGSDVQPAARSGQEPGGNPASVAPSNSHAGGQDTCDDRLLVDRVRAGDVGAYDLLVARYADRIHAMLRNLVGGDADAAAELTQEAFVRAFSRLDQFAGGSSFYTWLWRLARNRALDLLARRRPRSADLQEGAWAADAPAPGDRMAGEELRAAVRAALGRLPAEQREILLLREFDGLDYQQIAEALDVPEGTVKSRLNRARAALRAALEGRIVAEDIA